MPRNSFIFSKIINMAKNKISELLMTISTMEVPMYFSIYLSMALQPLVDLDSFFSFLIYIQSVGLLGRGISPSQGRYLHTEQYKQNKRTQTSMPRVGFEPIIPVFERVKTVHASDLATTVIGLKESAH
jgi:hypothetical protein